MFDPGAKRSLNLILTTICLIVSNLLELNVSGVDGTTNHSVQSVQFTEFLVGGRQQLRGSHFGTSEGGSADAVEEESMRINKIRISTANQQIKFTFGPTQESSKQPIRLRYRLEGYETGWHDIGDPMRFVIHFRDSQDVPVGSADFPVHGDSPEWTGRIETSRFIERKETVVVPDRCSNARIWIPSGGNPDTVGIYVIDNLRVIRLPEAGQEEEVLLFDDFETGRDLDNPLGDVDGWVRDGTSLSIAQVVKTGRGMHDHALALIDDAPDKFGAWDATDKKLLRVKPGEKLLLEWQEMYSVGGNRLASAFYPHLPAGEYRFIVRPVSLFGVPVGEEAALSFQVTPPFYRQGWFQASSLLLGFGLLIGVGRYTARRRLQRQFERLEFEHMVEKERSRIAQDIHDDLGTRLTRVSLLSEAVSRDAGPSSKLSPGLEEISATAKEMTRALDEIVWAVDPKQDSLDSLVSYVTGFAQDLLQMAGIKCRLSFPAQLPSWILLPDVRHNLFLAFSEVLNNVVKHAHAKEVHICLELGSAHFILSITDDGCGFDQTTLLNDETKVGSLHRPAGSGLINLKKRLDNIKGSLVIQCQRGRGTNVIFRVPVQPSSMAVDGRSRD
jgi:signal transduction histidine kinase